MPEPEGSERDPVKRVWFLDTSSLLSMAVDERIEAAVLDEIGDDPVMIIDIVHDELTRRAGMAATAGLAGTALSRFQPRWTIMATDRYVTLEDVQVAQEDVHARRQHSRAPSRTRPEQAHDPGSSRRTRRTPPRSRAGPSRDRQRLRGPY
jgi:hypothetical protein